ncbi:phosphoribosylaminoimidazolesuccinocarboxamide synthase [Candidatus Hydrogenosomobacter endosymbioticus]|uniref:Phosphoribosylaminoimidazole-succinocarboxamide synthase n=1 Tax=Candidatus Hydrogenosomobacter endosymbioticus TaxID=2558174 RepID=A0ABM7V9B4_9PROT|nr:phosphoribosylaminoimidazolesuccinocarboxamide synthase [Candidatus Hydrogenosomobacter endosymbioticus]BDB96384.1 phosphoribosylaminoimidazole-succinocarboxamide synthase [Candidatus Hydrogenosomobacter endosymbioticus]
MNRGKVLYEMPGKIIYEHSAPSKLLHYFTDTYRCAFTGRSEAIIGKGAVVNRISALLFSKLRILGVENHFFKALNMRESVVSQCDSVGISVVARTAAIGEFAKRYGIQEGKRLDKLAIDYFLDNNRDELGATCKGQPISEGNILSFSLLDHDDLDEVASIVSHATSLLRGLFIGIGFYLLEITFCIGKGINEDSEFILTGEISPETFCLEDIDTGDIIGGTHILSGQCDPFVHYQRVAARLGIHLSGPSISSVIPFSAPKTGCSGIGKRPIVCT